MWYEYGGGIWVSVWHLGWFVVRLGWQEKVKGDGEVKRYVRARGRREKEIEGENKSGIEREKRNWN